ncbi:hypothetical protein ABPG72_012112 [Tetrahymena utriculariae]
MDSLNIISNNINPNKLYFIAYDKNDFMADIQIDSINRLNYQISKQDGKFPCCCICLCDFDTILQDISQNKVKASCNHLYCSSDFKRLQINSNNQQLNCVLCRELIFSKLELKEIQELNLQPNIINLRVENFMRLDMNYFLNSKCKNCGQQGLPALVKCCACNYSQSNLCVSCIADSAQIDFIKREYNNILFYCGCTIQLSFISLQNREPSEIETLHAKYQTNPAAYSSFLIQKINQFNQQQIIQWKIIYCPACPLNAFQQQHQKKKHIKKSHNDLCHIMYPKSVKCQFCQLSYATQSRLNQHKCKQAMAPNRFFQD